MFPQVISLEPSSLPLLADNICAIIAGSFVTRLTYTSRTVARSSLPLLMFLLPLTIKSQFKFIEATITNKKVKTFLGFTKIQTPFASTLFTLAHGVAFRFLFLPL